MASIQLFTLLLCATYFKSVQLAMIRNRTSVPRFGRSEIVEGDILVQRRPMSDLSCRQKLKPVTTAESSIWPDGVIPFEMDSSLLPHACIIRSAMLHIMLKSCIYFRQKTDSDAYYLKIFKGNGCYATIGQNADFPEAKLPLGTGCHKFGIVLHQLMHVMGFEHEHRRHDRDRHIDVIYDNIDSSEWHNFERNDQCEEETFAPFDIDSIMLYSSKAFSKDGKSVTLRSKVSGKMVQSDKSERGLSKHDADSISLLYKCTHMPLERHHICEKFLQSFFQMNRCRNEAAKYLDFSQLRLFSSHVDANRLCDHLYSANSDLKSSVTIT